MIYSSYQELMVQGVDPSHLIGLIQEDEEEEEDNERVKYCYTDDTDSKFLIAHFQIHLICKFVSSIM